MHNKQTLTLTGIGMLGTAALLAGCGGSSLSNQNLSTRPNTLPYIYGLEPVAYYGAANNIGAQAAIEGSGFQAATGGQAFITGDTAFTASTALGATLPATVDPSGTRTLPTVFSTGGSYVDAQNQIGTAVVPVTAMPAGTSVYFRAAIANGYSGTGASPITGATLTSTDAQLAPVAGLTAGLPLTFATGASAVGGAFSNATYVTGTGGAATPFTIPASTTAGLHTVAATVTDAAGRVTSTTFIFPVVTPSTVCLFAQNITADGQTGTPKATAIAAGDTVTIDGAAGSGTYPAGFTPNTADPQGTVVFFVAPGTHTLVDTHPVPAVPAKGTTPAVPATTVVTTQTLTIAATSAGGTVIQ